MAESENSRDHDDTNKDQESAYLEAREKIFKKHEKFLEQVGKL